MPGIRPDLKVLFASGYTDDVIVQRQLLEHGASFLQKPFTPARAGRKSKGSARSVSAGLPHAPRTSDELSRIPYAPPNACPTPANRGLCRDDEPRIPPPPVPRRPPAASLALALGALAAPRSAAAQSLYMPRAIAQTYRDGTRSMDGMPGAGYWQNRGRYAITIATMPPDRRVSGTEQIVYLNNSPDTLRTLVIKLFPNYHKPARRATAGRPPDSLTSGIHIRSFAVNGKDTAVGQQRALLHLAARPSCRQRWRRTIPCGWRSAGTTTSPNSPAARA